MSQSPLRRSPRGWQGRWASKTGQAFIEFVFVTFMMVVLLFGLIDFGRAIYERQVLVNLSREGSNLASRGTTLSNTVTAVIASAAPLSLTTKGRVIVTSVINSNGTMRISEQISQGGLSVPSNVGTGINSVAKVPNTNPVLPQPNQTLYVTEVFYKFAPITPIGKLMNFTLPSTNFYDVAYF